MAADLPPEILRSDPTNAPNMRVAGIRYPQILLGKRSYASLADVVHHEALSITGIPMREPMKVASQTTALKVYPDYGGTTPSQAGMGTNQLKLNAAVTSLVVPGMLLYCVAVAGGGDANLVGEWAAVDAWDNVNKIATVNHNWVGTPTAAGGDTFLLLVPTVRASRLAVISELEGAGYNCLGALHWFGTGLTHEVVGDVVSRAPAPRPNFDGPFQLAAPVTGASNFRTAEGATYRHGSTIERSALGGVGCLFELLTAPADSKKVSVWLGVM